MKVLHESNETPVDDLLDFGPTGLERNLCLLSGLHRVQPSNHNTMIAGAVKPPVNSVVGFVPLTKVHGSFLLVLHLETPPTFS